MESKIGVINSKGEIVIPFNYDKINPFYHNYAMLINNNSKKITFYDYDGKIKVEHKAKEFYDIKGLVERPLLILDDKKVIRHDGKIIQEVE